MMQDIDTVIVTHTRGECASETVRKCLLHFNLQSKQIHRHCFTGDAEEANLWISSFKHVKFSISSIILNSKQLQESVQAIPSSQMMLESDSPYLSPNPWNIPQHAALIASLKDKPLSLFNHLTSSNTRTLYYIPSVPPKQQPHPRNAPKSTLFKTPTIGSRNCIPFNGANTPFSNFFPCNVIYQKQSFHNIEQIYQWVKSIDIGNNYIASEIWQLTDGYAIKNYSNKLLLPTVEQWRTRRGVTLMLELIELKYDQVQVFKNACHESGHPLLLETTTDKFWGVGCRCHEANHKDIMAFTGHNLLGLIIMFVHDKSMGKDTTWIKDLHHIYPDILLFQGIKHLLKFL